MLDNFCWSMDAFLQRKPHMKPLDRYKMGEKGDSLGKAPMKGTEPSAQQHPQAPLLTM